jgi:hypothetical protein
VGFSLLPSACSKRCTTAAHFENGCLPMHRREAYGTGTRISSPALQSYSCRQVQHALYLHCLKGQALHVCGNPRCSAEEARADENHQLSQQDPVCPIVAHRIGLSVPIWRPRTRTQFVLLWRTELDCRSLFGDHAPGPSLSYCGAQNWTVGPYLATTHQDPVCPTVARRIGLSVPV